MTPSIMIKCLWICGVSLSLYMSFQIMMERRHFEVIANEDGRPLLETDE